MELDTYTYEGDKLSDWHKDTLGNGKWVLAEDAEKQIAVLKSHIDYRLNEHLCEMKPEYDDSITGFNEAWDIVRSLFAEAISEIAPNLHERDSQVAVLREALLNIRSGMHLMIPEPQKSAFIETINTALAQTAPREEPK